MSRRWGALVAALLVLAGALSLVALRVSAGSKTDVERLAEDSVRALSESVETPLAEPVLEGARVSRSESDLGVVEEGKRLLERYRGRGDCVVAQAGYLDLGGRTWGCVMQGEGWVELCVVQEGDEGGSTVVTWRMDADDVDV